MKIPSHYLPDVSAIGMAADSPSTLRWIPVTRIAPAYCPEVSHPMLSAPLPAASSASARRFSARGYIEAQEGVAGLQWLHGAYPEVERGARESQTPEPKLEDGSVYRTRWWA